MYAHPKLGYMPKFKPAKKRGRKTDLSKFLARQGDLFSVELHLVKVRAAK